MLQPLVDLLNSDAEQCYGQPVVDGELNETDLIELKATIDTGLTTYEVPVSQPPPQHIVEGLLINIPETDSIRNDSIKRECTRTKRGSSSSSHNVSTADGLPKPAAKMKKCDRERTQRVNRDAFRKKVLTLVTSWIGRCENGELLKRSIVINEDSCKPKKRNKNLPAYTENTSDILTNKQNGYYFYHILCTKEIESLVAHKRLQRESESDMDVLVERLALMADIFLRVMFNNNISTAVFIKFDDTNIPALFARQTKQMVDTCVSGPPGRYWTKILHLDNVVKTSQHITLQRVCFGRLMQDCTFVVVGEGGMLEQIYSVTPEHFVSPSRSRRCFKEMYNYIVSIPENDLSCLGWEVIDKNGVLDPIKTFLPKVISAEKRSSDDLSFVNYLDMFVTMLVHRHKMESLHVYYDAEGSNIYYDSPPQPIVYRTEYKFELAGRAEHPGVYFYRNRDDYITELCMLNMADNLYDPEENLERMLSDVGDGIYFYDIQPVNDILLKLKSRDITPLYPEHDDFYRYMLSECDDVQEMIAYSSHTIEMRLEDVLRDNTYERLHETDPARFEPKKCLENLDRIVVMGNLKEYKSTYYIEKSYSLVRAIAELPKNLSSKDCVLRSYRLRWKGTTGDGKSVFVMFPIFTVVFKNFSLFQQIIPETVDTMPDEDFTLPGTSESRFVPLSISTSEQEPYLPDSHNPLPNFGRGTEPVAMPTARLDMPSLLTTTGETRSNGSTNTYTETMSLLAAGFSIPEFNFHSSPPQSPSPLSHPSDDYDPV